MVKKQIDVYNDEVMEEVAENIIEKNNVEKEEDKLE
jgi:hypothetical protein